MKQASLFLFFTYLTGAALAKPKPVHHEVDVAIIGGGATGAYAAVRLREDYGKSVLVIEKENKLGGHVHAYHPNGGGRPINYGVQAYLSRETTKAFFKRFNVGLIDPDLQSGFDLLFGTKDIDFNTGRNVDVDYGLINSTVALIEYAALATKYQPWFENGYFKKGKIPEDLLLPFGEFLTKHNIVSSLEILRTLIWLSDAVNTPTWFVMAVVGQPQLAALGFGLTGPSFKWPETYSSETLYDRVFDLMKDDVLLQSTVVSSSRKANGVDLVVQTPSGKRHVKAKKLLIAATPSPDNTEPWDLDVNEKSIFSKFSWETLYVSVVSKTNLPAAVAGIRNAWDNPSNFYLPQGNFVDAYTRAGNTDLWTTRVLGGATLTAQKARSLIRQVFTKIDAAGTYDTTEPDILAFASHGLTVPKVSPKELAAGFYKKLYALQGQRNTFWTGLTWAPDYTPILWDFTEKLLPQIVSSISSVDKS
ncbi:amine oxidase [Fusarium sporotrichioides]|uniref:Amine oxidase n=1 Tax=Fusarium sporotrichioides TaxID=5514 RepID=A0A395RVV5_FUSSP|nr:amine oxidase [Fusarium sporotrichioides]